MPNIDDYWFRYKSACEIEGQKLEYISKQALTELIAEIISSPVEPEVSDDFGDLKKMPNVKVKIEGDAGGYWLYGVDWMHHKYLVDRKCGLEWVDWYKCKTKSQNSR